MVQNIGIIGKSDLTVLKFIIEEKENAMLSHSVMSDSETPWTIAHQAPLSMGISQARILKLVAISFFRGSSQLMDQTCISCLADSFLLSHLGSLRGVRC